MYLIPGWMLPPGSIGACAMCIHTVCVHAYSMYCYTHVCIVRHDLSWMGRVKSCFEPRSSNRIIRAGTSTSTATCTLNLLIRSRSMCTYTVTYVRTYIHTCCVHFMMGWWAQYETIQLRSINYSNKEINEDISAAKNLDLYRNTEGFLMHSTGCALSVFEYAWWYGDWVTLTAVIYWCCTCSRKFLHDVRCIKYLEITID